MRPDAVIDLAVNTLSRTSTAHHVCLVPIMARSPRVRGNHVGAAGVVRVDRSIPARTGEPLSSFGVRSRPTVYPRAYGGTSTGLGETSGETGLSPRVRGNHVGAAGVVRVDRSIPARTGEPFWRAVDRREPRVYPRAYGGTAKLVRRALKANGLSPRVRGNPLAARPLAKPNSSRVTTLVVLYQVHSVSIDYGLWRLAKRPDVLLTGSCRVVPCHHYRPLP